MFGFGFNILAVHSSLSIALNMMQVTDKATHNVNFILFFLPMGIAIILGRVLYHSAK